jgi:MFS family permease
MHRTAQAWLVWELTDRAIYLGLVAACGTLPMLLLALPAGVLADRLRKRNVLLVTQSLAMLQAFVLAALVHTGIVQVWHVMVLAAFLGTVWALDMPTRHAIVLELVPREDALNAVSLNSSAINIGRLIGPAVAGVLMAKVGLGVCFLANGMTFLALIAAVATIPPRDPGSTDRSPMFAQIADGLRWVRQNPVPFALLGLITVCSLYGLSYVVLVPVLADDVFEAGVFGYSLLMVAHAAGALAAAYVLMILGPRWRLGGVALTGALWFPIALIVVAVVNTYSAAAIGLVFTGAGMMAFNVVANTMLQRGAPEDMRGRVMSLRTFVFAGMSWLGAVQMAALAEGLGVQAAILIGGVICFIAAVIAAWRVPQLRHSD